MIFQVTKVTIKHFIMLLRILYLRQHKFLVFKWHYFRPLKCSYFFFINPKCIIIVNLDNNIDGYSILNEWIDWTYNHTLWKTFNLHARMHNVFSPLEIRTCRWKERHCFCRHRNLLIKFNGKHLTHFYMFFGYAKNRSFWG